MRASIKVWVVVATLLFAIGVEAQAPARFIPFQARLTNVSNQPVPDGVYSLTFNIYDQAEAGETCWTEPHQNVSVINGQINVILGAITSLDDPDPLVANDAINFNPESGTTCVPDENTSCGCQGRGQRYLGITVGNNPLEMVPRHQLVPSFHARRADVADDIVDGAITTAKLAVDAVTQDRIADNAITSSQIVDGTIVGSDFSTALFAGGNGIRGDQIKDGEVASADITDGTIKGVDLSTADAEGVTSQNIKNGTIEDQDLSLLPSVKVYGTQSQTLPFWGTTPVAILFNQRVWDDSQMHCEPSENYPGDPTCSVHLTSRLYAPRAGYYRVSGTIAMSNSCGGFVDGLLCIRRNGSEALACRYHTGGDGSVETVAQLTANDYVELTARAGDGSCTSTSAVEAVSANQALNPAFSMTLMR